MVSPKKKTEQPFYRMSEYCNEKIHGSIAFKWFEDLKAKGFKCFIIRSKINKIKKCAVPQSGEFNDGLSVWVFGVESVASYTYPNQEELPDDYEIVRKHKCSNSEIVNEI